MKTTTSLLWLVLTGTAMVRPVAGQELGPAPTGDLADFVPAPARLTRQAVAVNPSDRAAVINFYQNGYRASQSATAGWTGDRSCDAGTTTREYADATLLRVNYFRAMAGLPGDVTLSNVWNLKCQAAALMMSVNNALSHTPPTNWICYSRAIRRWTPARADPCEPATMRVSVASASRASVASRGTPWLLLVAMHVGCDESPPPPSVATPCVAVSSESQAVVQALAMDQPVADAPVLSHRLDGTIIGRSTTAADGCATLPAEPGALVTVVFATALGVGALTTVAPTEAYLRVHGPHAAAVLNEPLAGRLTVRAGPALAFEAEEDGDSTGFTYHLGCTQRGCMEGTIARCPRALPCRPGRSPPTTRWR